MSVSQETVRPQPRRRTPRPYQVVVLPDKVRTFASRKAAEGVAQQCADETGRPWDLRDTARGLWLPRVRPAQHRCQNGRCGAALTAAEFDAAWSTFRCRHCPPTTEGA